MSKENSLINNLGELSDDILIPAGLVKKILTGFEAISCQCCSLVLGYQDRVNQTFLCHSPKCLGNWATVKQTAMKTMNGEKSCSSGVKGNPPKAMDGDGTLRVQNGYPKLTVTRTFDQPPATRAVDQSFASRAVDQSFAPGISRQPRTVEQTVHRIVRPTVLDPPSHVKESSEIVGCQRKPLSALVDLGKCLKSSPFLKQRPASIFVAKTTAEARVAPTQVVANKPWTTVSQRDKKTDLFRRNHGLPSQLGKPDVKRGGRPVWMIRNVSISESLKDGAQVTMRFMYNPTKFSVTAVADNARIESLEEAIKVYCEREPNLSVSPYEGEIVFAPYKEHGYYRAVVQNIQRRLASVKFLDYGDKDDIAYENCKQACHEIMEEHPIYGMTLVCKTKVRVPRKLLLPEETLDLLTEFKMQWNSKEQWTCYGDLLFDNSVTWSEILEKRMQEANTQPPSGLNLSDEEFEVPNAFQNNRLLISDMAVSPNLRNGALVRIPFKWSWDKLLVMSDDDTKALDKLNESIAKCVCKTTPLKRTPGIKEVVLAAYNNRWTRAVVESVKDDVMEVTFIDIGGSAGLKVDDMKELTPEIRQHPLYTIIFLIPELKGVRDVSQTSEIKAVLERQGQIEVVSVEDKYVWSGKFWVAQNLTWTDLVLKQRVPTTDNNVC